MLKDIQFLKTAGKVVNNIDFGQVKAKADSYDIFSSLHSDFSWIVHNFQIMHPNKPEIQAAAAKLQFVEEEIESVLDCTHYYTAAHEHKVETVFPTICKTPHPIVWAFSMEETLYWPAKAMRVLFDNEVRVRYFGEYTNEIVQVKTCFLFSKNPPIDQSSPPELYQIAMRVGLNVYVILPDL